MSALPVEDQLAIQQLYARYNHALDAGQGDAWAGCFTPDGTFTSASGHFEGREALAGFAVAFAQRMKARHWTNNLVVTGANDAAEGTCYLMLLRLNPDGPASIVTTAIYSDRLVKAGDGWKFASRIVTADA
jgi:3-phenylpropionate/cinnamic acid dioxygenase small subunit